MSAGNIFFSQTFNLTDSIFSTGDIYKPQVGKIQFMFYSDSIIPLSYPTLDSVADFLLKNPNIIIEIGVHSDSRGSDKYSFRISPRRAQSVKLYLIKKAFLKTEL